MWRSGACEEALAFARSDPPDPLPSGPIVMGVVNVTPDSFSDGGEFLDRRRRHRPRRQSSPPTARRSSTSAASPRGRAPTRLGRGGAAPGRAGGRGAGRGRARRLGARSTPPRPPWPRRRWRPARRIVNDVVGVPVRPRAGGPGRRARRDVLPDAHARRAAHDAGRPALRRRGLRRQGLPRGAARVRRRRGRRRGARLARSRASASARPSSTTSSCCAGSTRSSRSAGRWWSAPRARASSGKLAGGRGGATACRARSRPTCSRSSAARSVFRVHDVAQVADALAVAAATVGRRRSADDGPRAEDDLERDEPDDDEAPEPTVTVEITGLSLYTQHGVSEAERELGQRLVIDVEFELADCDAMVTDRVEDTVDYARRLRAGRPGRAGALVPDARAAVRGDRRRA